MFNKIGAPGVSLQAPSLPITLVSGTTLVLPSGAGASGQFGNSLTSLLPSNQLSGQYMIQLSTNASIEVFDPGQQIWRSMVAGGASPAAAVSVTVSSDGTNFRLANTLGCPTGATITAPGSGYVSGFYGYNQLGQSVMVQNGAVTMPNSYLTVTASIGGSAWNALIGGSVNTTISLSGTAFSSGAYGSAGASFTASGGSLFTRAPAIVFYPPPNQGSQPYILPTAICTISGGAINSVTVVSQGAGLVGLPGITVVPQVGDTTGGGALLGWIAANSADPNAGKLTALWPAFYGVATSVPTLTFSPAGAAATATGNTFGAGGNANLWISSL